MSYRSRRAAAALLATAALSLSLAVTTTPADAAAKHYKNCAALNKAYPHGVGRTGAKDKTTGRKVTNFKVSTAIYNANNGPRNTRTGEYDLDRDNDGIACEKR